MATDDKYHFDGKASTIALYAEFAPF